MPTFMCTHTCTCSPQQKQQLELERGAVQQGQGWFHLCHQHQESRQHLDHQCSHPGCKGRELWYALQQLFRLVPTCTQYMDS